MHVQVTVWPPGWLITSSPSLNPVGQPSPACPGGPGGPGSPFGPCGPVAPFTVTVRASVLDPTPNAVAVRKPAPPANAIASTSNASGRLIRVHAPNGSLPSKPRAAAGSRVPTASAHA